MSSRIQFTSSAITILAIFVVVSLSSPEQTFSQSSSSKPTTTWQDLGFNRFPEGLSAEMLPLFEGLNEARGTWALEGERAEDGAVQSLKGSLHIHGLPKVGMIPIWQIALEWPADNPEHSVIFKIMAGPDKDGIELMLIRIGPAGKPGTENSKLNFPPARFQGTWNLESRTIAWSERSLPGQTRNEAPPKLKQSFDMIVAEDGKILIRNAKHMPQGQFVSARAVDRTGEAPPEPVILTGKHSFKTVAEITDSRIKPWLPPQATEISLLSERNGHFARYKIEETNLKTFLDKMWETGKESSAHERNEMHGEGELASRERMAARFKAAEWKPLDKAVIYYSPSKRSGAMTTYYYDKEAGIAYHDRGYW